MNILFNTNKKDRILWIGVGVTPESYGLLFYKADKLYIIKNNIIQILMDEVPSLLGLRPAS